MKPGTCACLFFGVALVAAAASSLFAQTTSPSLAKELAATWDRAAQDLIDVAEAMPEERYEFKPTPEMSTKSIMQRSAAPHRMKMVR
jgi:hypothetical protein